jgi:uncharacterized membrane-anchored protein
MTGRAFLLASVVVALAQTIAIGALIQNRAHHLSTGREVVLETGFIDPRDLFRGHYVTLNLLVGDLEAETAVDAPFTAQEPVFVQLAADETSGYWRASKLFHQPPRQGDAPFIRGRVTAAPAGPDGNFRISFPFDRYFAARDRAVELEQLRRDQRLGVVLALDADGGGYIKGLMVDGEIIYDEPPW